ncbi:MAG: class IIb bacteriocin, lactobin A/cerein 7B family [Bacilli bacterium]|jgi:lactobin A/cerein 7B family class IIb bacteriocin
MKELQKEELLMINGGLGIWAIIGIVSGITFLIGLLDGFVRPLKCN